jgi:hypothetical protein
MSMLVRSEINGFRSQKWRNIIIRMLNKVINSFGYSLLSLCKGFSEDVKVKVN